MAKRERSEANSVEVKPTVIDREESVSTESATVGENATTERDPPFGSAAGETLERPEAEYPQPVATGEPPSGAEQGTETI